MCEHWGGESPVLLFRTSPPPPLPSPEVTEALDLVHELHSLGFGRHTHEELLHGLHLRQENRGSAMEDALTVIRDMHQRVSVT